MVLPRRLKKKVRKTLVFFVKFAKRLIAMQKNVGTKASPKGKKIFFFASKSYASTKSNEWYVDSGCSNHMTGDEKAFLSINNSITTKVKMVNGALVDAKGKGTISINMK